MKAAIQKEAKRVLKKNLPKDKEVLTEVANNIVKSFNQLSTLFAQQQVNPSPEQDNIFIYCRTKVEKVFIRLRLRYVVPKRFGEKIERTKVLADTDTYSVTLLDSELEDSDDEKESDIVKNEAIELSEKAAEEIQLQQE